MTLIEEIGRLYRDRGGMKAFYADVRMHMDGGGYVFKAPEFLLMGYPVWRDPERPKMGSQVGLGSPNCWHIYLAVGDMSRFLDLEPYPLPYFSWERRKRLVFVGRERLLRRS